MSYDITIWNALDDLTSIRYIIFDFIEFITIRIKMNKLQNKFEQNDNNNNQTSILKESILIFKLSFLL